MPAHQLLERARVDDPKDSNFVPSECLLYLFRRQLFDDGTLRDLFVILRQRVFQATHVILRHIPGSKELAARVGDLDIQDEVMQRFQEFLCLDRKEYEERLDFFEARFNAAIAALRKTARKKVRRHEERYESTDFSDAGGESSEKLVKALLTMRDALDDESLDFLYRTKLLAAIDSLPPEEKQVIELIMQGFQIDSKEEGTLTIVKILGCVEKTVHNRKNRAFERLREALKKEEEI